MHKVDKTPADQIAASIPRDYLDGCTLFPDKFGNISHRDVCIKHDIEYWTNRTAVSKFKADWKWFLEINNAHRINTTFYRIVVFLASIIGLVVLTTFGWVFWLRRHTWDKS